MNNLLPFAESLLCWQLTNYATGSDPVRGDNNSLHLGHPKREQPAWLRWIALRSLCGALLLLLLNGFAWTSCLLAGCLLVGSLVVPVARRYLIPLTSLAEFEAAANSAIALVAWLICIQRPDHASPVWIPQLNSSQLAALCICTALLIYMIRGGSFFVRGILAKAGSLPGLSESNTPSTTVYRHGTLIGQVERVIVVLIVMTGNYATLAFFFAAKGLIRSRELEDRTLADYFLLGSLSSFLLALVAGMIMQNTIARLWK
jgi:hypothetical protein